MLRPLLAVAAVAAFALPTSAGAAGTCQTVHVVTACVDVATGLSHTFVNPTVSVSCEFRHMSPCAGIGPVSTGRTGIEQGSGDIWVAGSELPLK